ncbi:MAG: alcohol dehydrogenase catalytic domain-containing protein [Chloroflexota bacterium]|nr:alcohol dehydrogenase catalytic domain-containing protein [Chloroflexota bacterium]
MGSPMDSSTHGLRYRLSIPKYLAVQAMEKVLPSRLASSGMLGLEYTPIPSKALPGADWLRLRPLLCGICGSDMALLTARNGPALSPFSSFPAVMGHEIVAEAIEVGPDVASVSKGDRVVVDPFISCEMRGLEPCPSCSAGQRCLCTRTAEGNLAPGMLVGFCRDLPGGWSGEMVAHRSQVYRVPDEVLDDVAVLVEPFSVALHAVLKLPPAPGSHVLILGGGALGLLVLAALRLLGLDCHVTVVARYPIQVQMAGKLGADVVHKHAGAAAVEVTGAVRYKPVKGRPVYTGGFDMVYDCVGTARSLDDAMRVASPDGKVILVGCVGEICRADLSFIWARELHVTGSYGYSTEHGLEGKPHTFEIALDLLGANPDCPIGELVTHRFPLSKWSEAIDINRRRSRSGAIKTIFDCRESGERRAGVAPSESPAG